jgi:hypothetical protein
MADRVLIDMTISAPVAEVWDAVRDPAKGLRWFGWDSDSLADEVDFIFVKYAKADEATGTILFEGTQDRFEITPDGAGTRLRVVRAAPADGAAWEDVYEDMTEGWIAFVLQLKFAIERHGLGERRTLYFTAPKGERTGERPMAALGLGDLAGAAEGAAYERAIPTGDSLKGTVWYASKWQVALTVEAWGDGLLDLHDAGSWTAGGGHGAGMAILTTYGLSDAAFADLESRWKAWWEPRFSKPA